MRQASDCFTDEQRSAIAAAVADAEASTAAEILPVVATRSGRYDRAEDTAGVFVGLLLLAGTWRLFEGVDAEGEWGLSPARFELPAMILSLLLGLVLGSAAAARIGALGRLFTPRREMAEEVAERARAVFFDQRVHHTLGRGGVLLFLSLHERMALVLADDAVVERLGQEALDEACAGLVAAMRARGPSVALAEAIRSIGGRLARVLPRETCDRNEIGDALVTLDD